MKDGQSGRLPGTHFTFVQNENTSVAHLGFRRFVPGDVGTVGKEYGYVRFAGLVLFRLCWAFLDGLDLDHAFPPFRIVLRAYALMTFIGSDLGNPTRYHQACLTQLLQEIVVVRMFHGLVYLALYFSSSSVQGSDFANRQPFTIVKCVGKEY